MTTFILVRHGQSQANLDACFAGQSNPSLTEQGILQAERLAAWVADHYKIDRIYASDLTRAYQTALPLSKMLHLDIETDMAFREIYAGLWQGQPFEYIKKTYARDYSMWLEDIGNAVCTGGESVRDLSLRVYQKMCQIGEREEDKTVIIFTHATPIRAFQTLCEKGDIAYAKDVPWTANASVSLCIYDGEKFRFTLVGYNDFLDDLKSAFPSGIV